LGDPIDYKNMVIPCEQGRQGTGTS
jgi:hypothetical protein